MHLPFPVLSVPQAENVDRIYDPHGFADDVRNCVKLVAENKYSIAGAIIGNYGFGKTHILLYTLNHVRKHYKNSFTVYVPSPGSSFKTIYKRVMEKVLESNHAKNIVDSVDDPLRSALASIISNDKDSYYIKQWLLGEPVPSKHRQKLGLGPRISDEQAVLVLAKILHTLAMKGTRPIVLVIDEMEDIISLNSLKRLQYLNNLRRLVDEMPNHMLLLVSSTPAGWNEIINTHPALARRLSSFIVYLKPFTRDEIKGLLEFYVENNGGNCRLVLDDSIIDVIYEYSEGNPGEALKLAAVTQLYITKKKLVESDPNKVREVLSKHV